MAQTGYTPIQLYRTTTASATPTAGNLTDGELAINTTDEKLYFKNASGTVKLLAANVMPVANGGTGATTASVALTNLGAVAKAGDTMTGVLAFTAGTVSAPGITFSGDTNTGIFSPAADTIAFTEGGAESMRIDSSGNVGIGTSSPSEKLSVHSAIGIRGSNFASLSYFGSSVNTTGVYTGLDSAGGYVVNVRDAGYQAFLTNNTERLRIDSSGNVGIGTSSPGNAKLNTQGFGSYRGNAYTIASFAANSTLAPLNIVQATDGTIPGISAGQNSSAVFNALGFYTSEAERMRIDTSGNVGIGTSSPASLLHLNKGSGAADIRFSVAGVLYGTAYASSSDMTVSSVTAIPLKFGTNNTERMQIDSSGNVGIGTTSPAGKVSTERASASAGWAYHVKTTGISNDSGIYMTASNNFEMVLRDSSANLSTITNNGNNLVLSTAGTERFRIASAGQLGIGGANYGTSGQVLTSNGSAAAPSWNTVSASKAAETQTFNSSGTWTKPSGYGASAKAFLQVFAGGGSGGRFNTGGGGGGGGGGGYSEAWVLLSSLGATETITIGAGGAAVSTNVSGNAGGTSSIGSIISAYGGAGGQTGDGGGGGGQFTAGSASTGGLAGGGSPGTGGSPCNPAGKGGSTTFGGGGGGGNGNTVAAAAGGDAMYGGGGGGGAASGSPGAGGKSYNGGAGGAGSTSTGTAGTAPSGGGGGGRSGSSGAGASGRVIITVFDGV